MKLLFLFTPFLFATLQGLTQSIDSVVAGLNNIARPILTTDPDYNFGDIEFLKTTLKGSAIIGLGESTHGTEVYTRYKQRLIRFLVSNMGVKTIIDEGDILAAEKVDDYINGRTDSLANVGNLRPAITKITELNWLRA
jgi:erythromycin esterase-like protein